MISYVFSQTGLVAGGVVTGPAFAQRAPVSVFVCDRAADRPHRRPEGR